MSRPAPSTEEIESRLSAAQAALQEGQLPKALALFQAVLALDPQNGLANYWVGVLALKASRPREALTHLEIAAADLPDQPDVHLDLGLTCQALGDADRAQACFKNVRDLVPGYAAAQLSLADRFMQENKLKEAVESCQRALAAFPRDLALLRRLADLHFALRQGPEALKVWQTLLELRPDCAATHLAFGTACYEVGEFDQAREAFHRVVRLQPDSLSALLNLALTLQKLGHFQDALECFRRGLTLDPQKSDIYKGMGDVHRDLGQWADAIAAWQKALELRPDYAEAWQNLGLALEYQNRLDEARACHRRVVQLRPNNSTAHRYLGMVCQDLGELEMARDCYHKALELDPNDADAHWALFSLLAAQGDFATAWAEHEWRWQIKNRTTPKREFDKPRWDGGVLAGKTILLYGEQGFGDMIQAARYVSLVQARGGRVLLWSAPDLVALLRSMPDVAQVFHRLNEGVDFDFQLPVMSLPLIFRTTLETIPDQVPYLRAPEDVRFTLPKTSGPRVRVGLVWCGSRSQPNDRRPIPLECLSPLFQIADADFYSLQKGPAVLDKNANPPAERVIDLSPELADFAVTAAVLEQLDLVITVDTAVAHLAGALGKPVWVLLSFAPDWRWMLAREDSPWYPTMRLFRQVKPGDWEEVVARVAQALQHRVATHQHASVNRWLGQGLAHHQNGRLAEAEEFYWRVIEADPGHADALRFMGVLARQRGKLECARAWLARALAIHPHSAQAHCDLGLVWFELGRWDKAIEACCRAIELQPHFPEAHYNLGNAYYAAQNKSEAAACYRKASEQQPEFAEAHYNLGLLAQEGGRSAEAISHYERAVRCQPTPRDALLNLGLALKDTGRADEAEACLRKLLEMSPSNERAQTNLASLLTLKGELEAAEQLCAAALRTQPSLAEAWLNLGVARQTNGAPAQALECFRRALEIQPEFADARYNLGIAELLLGKFESGWENYEARWQTSNPIFAPRDFPQPFWSGEDLAGRRLLVHAEQGHGDAIQFVRYLPLLAHRRGRILLECPGPLTRLLATVEGVTQIIARGAALPAFDFHVPLMSLPFRSKTTLGTIPYRVPYLRVPDGAAVNLPSQGSPRLKVGLTWAGSPQHGNDKARSIPLSGLAPWWLVDEVAFYSLQVGDSFGSWPSERPSARLIDLAPQLTDFAATAAAIQQMDLVISVDTAVAHLAGALGKPVWVLLPFAPDWRWLLEREDSPWYPTMRLFRQPNRGDWPSVIRRVRDALQAEISKFEFY